MTRDEQDSDAGADAGANAGANAGADAVADTGADAGASAGKRPLDSEGRRALLHDLESIRTLLDDLERNAVGIDPAARTTGPATSSGGATAEVGLPGAGPPGAGPPMASRRMTEPPIPQARYPGMKDSEARIPVLREVVRPAPARSEEAGGRDSDTNPASTSAQVSGISTDTRGELFDPRAFADRLLNDDWRQERDAILDAARHSARAFAAPGTRTPASLRDFDAAELRERLAAALALRVDALLDESLAMLRAALAETLHTELRRLIDDIHADRDDPDAPDAPSDTAANAADRDPDETD